MYNQKQEKIKVGITLGDAAGIGPEIIIKTFNDERLYKQFVPIVYANPRVFSYYKKALDVDKFQYSTVKNYHNLSNNSLNIYPAWNEEFPINVGEPNKETGKYALESIKTACEALKRKEIDVLVTAPINKSVIHSNEFPFAGHTEYLQQFFDAKETLMFLVADEIKIGLVTNHLRLQDVAKSITKDKIIGKLRLMHQSLQEDFGIEKPKIAVLSLNPHAGDNGVIGNEEKEIIYPAVQEAKKTNMLVFGPYAADGFFATGSFKQFDGILAMYHDQGLIPFKYIAQESGINFTAGLGIVRTSPDHGTAENIAGKGTADETSFRNAIFKAIDIYRNRIDFKEMRSNPLQKIARFQEEK